MLLANNYMLNVTATTLQLHHAAVIDMPLLFTYLLIDYNLLHKTRVLSLRSLRHIRGSRVTKYYIQLTWWNI